MLKNVLLTDGWYDVLKWIANIFLPPFLVLVTTIVELLNVPHGAIIVGILAAVMKFLQDIINASAKNYYKTEE